jgi:hypothetical protein
MMKHWNEKVALVTGATSRLGATAGTLKTSPFQPSSDHLRLDLTSVFYSIQYEPH